MTYITERSRAELMSYTNEHAIVTGKLERISSQHRSILITDVYIQLLSDNSILEYDHIWLGLNGTKIRAIAYDPKSSKVWYSWG